VHISSVLGDKVLYSCGDNEDVGRKKVSGGRGDLSKSINNFNRNICDLENRSFCNYLSDAKLLCALVREWLKNLKYKVEQLQARFKFKRNILGSLNQICCNLFLSFSRIIDEFEPCQVCRFHGYPLDDERGNKLVKSTSCPWCREIHTDFNTPIVVSTYFINLDFPLESLYSGLIVGTPIIIVPYNSNEMDDTDQAELNNQEELPPEPTSTQGDSLNESETSKQAIGMIGSEEDIP
nr:hypothetical protein [Tanacetum cinerariifolium]